MKYITTQDITIPAGTVLERADDDHIGYVLAFIGHGRDFTSEWLVQVHPDAIASGEFIEA